MHVDFRIGTIKSEADWKPLAEELGGIGNVVSSVIRHLINLNVTSYLIESRYIDRDYSSDYRLFYAQTFKNYQRHCKRIHFFAEDISGIFALSDWSSRVAALRKTSGTSYCGFCVVRPLPKASIGRTALKMRGPIGSGLDSVITCRADTRANVLGAELHVRGANFMQQDSRVGACAQVAIWMGARHMHQRYHYNWLSVADITKLAAPNTEDESTSLPAGSDFLTSERMIRAVHEMGFQALCFRGPEIGKQILPYVESGLPVILGLDVPGASIGHAVTVIGRTFAKIEKPTSNPIDFIAGFIVHDDQNGPYKVIPCKATSAKDAGIPDDDVVRIKTRKGDTVEFNLEKHGTFAMALMPVRAFSTAQAAEVTAQRRIANAFQHLESLKAQIAEEGDVNPLLNDLAAAHAANKIVLRTYLTSADGYRRYVADCSACDALKDVLLRLHLPHFTWITEISSADSYNNPSAGMRRIYGHSVLDATSSGIDVSGLLMLHLPGVAFLRDVNNDDPDKQLSAQIIEDDRLYDCRAKRPN